MLNSRMSPELEEELEEEFEEGSEGEREEKSSLEIFQEYKEDLRATMTKKELLKDDLEQLSCGVDRSLIMIPDIPSFIRWMRSRIAEVSSYVETHPNDNGMMISSAKELEHRSNGYVSILVNHRQMSDNDIIQVLESIKRLYETHLGFCLQHNLPLISYVNWTNKILSRGDRSLTQILIDFQENDAQNIEDLIVKIKVYNTKLPDDLNYFVGKIQDIQNLLQETNVTSEDKDENSVVLTAPMQAKLLARINESKEEDEALRKKLKESEDENRELKATIQSLKKIIANQEAMTQSHIRKIHTLRSEKAHQLLRPQSPLNNTSLHQFFKTTPNPIEQDRSEFSYSMLI
jgi:chromosome segregation ATPase